jgi:hypothetical protein
MQLCDYGCGQEALFQFKNGKWCCAESYKTCRGVILRRIESVKECSKLPEVKLRRSKSQKEAHNRPEVKIKHSKAAKEGWQNIETRRKHLEVWSNSEAKEKHRKRVKESHNTLEAKLNFSKKQIENWRNLEIREKIIKTSKEAMNKPEVKEKIRILNNRPKIIKGLRERMLDGGAVHALSFLKNSSKPQVALYKMLQQLCPNPIMNYPIYYRKKWNYSIDIADPRLGLAFEYDEPYWHKHKGRDLLRQRRIEEIGWKFLRYEKVPTLEQLKLDVLKLMSGE